MLVDATGNSVPLERVELTALRAGPFDEAWLQALIHANPSCLPIDEIESGLGRFQAICREMPTPHGLVDNVLMTPQGDIAIVETKLFRNPEARRKVVAQALDYAVSIFTMNYSAFEKAVLNGKFAGEPPRTLYEAVGEGEKLREDAFHDAVAGNLRKGRAVVLVVGDGIRAEAELLVEDLHRYGRFHFSLALIELAIFRMPGGQLLVRPRTLAKTVTLGRYVLDVKTGDAPVLLKKDSPESLSSEQYWEALQKAVPGVRSPVEALIEQAGAIDVYPEYLGGLNLKWQRSGGEKPLNLGYIRKNGAIWTDAASWFVPAPIAKAYVEKLAASWD
ncbi:MAG TPA: hypothetical protein VK634_15260, partial [Reyranella sp.]|nr:hypothetical protein [Reyranella sp.]